MNRIYPALIVSAAATAILLVVSDARRRTARRRTARLKELNAQKSGMERVVQRSRTLGELSRHLQELSEIEKRSLARELHDELGGLLVATKMDVVWLRRQLDNGDPDLAARWDRVLRSLEHGVDFKRRVIENLRPTLLDNLGLVPALHWLAEETCRPAGLQLHEDYAEDVPNLTGDANIALFRVAQESLNNIVHHADAKQVRIALKRDESALQMSISDDGRGIPPDQLNRPRSHGLSGMRHRMNVLGGQLAILANAGFAGTTVVARLPC